MRTRGGGGVGYQSACQTAKNIRSTVEERDKCDRNLKNENQETENRK